MRLPLRLAAVVLAAVTVGSPARAQLRPDWTAAPGGNNSINNGFRYVVPGPGGTVTVAGSSSPSYVERYAPGGARLWQAVGPQNNDAIAGLAVGADGTAFIALTTGGGGGTPSYNLAVRRVNADGTPGWNIERDGPNSGSDAREFDTIFDAAITPDGDVVVVGQSGFSAGSQTWTVRLDGATGAVEWERVYDYADAASDIDRPQRIGADCAGHVYSAGFGYLQGYVVEYMPDGTQVRAARIGFLVPGGGPAPTVLDEMHVACDGTVTVSGFSDVLGASRPRAYVAQITPGSGSSYTWATFPFAEEAFASNSRYAELAVDAAGRATMQVSLWNADRTSHEARIAQLDAAGAVRWSRPATSLGFGSSHYALAADASTVYTSVSYTAGAPNTQVREHQAYAAEDGAPLGSVPFVVTSQDAAVLVHGRGAAVDAAGGYVVSEDWQVRRLTTASASVAEVQVVHASAALALLGPIEVYLNRPATSTTPDAVVSFLSGTAFVSVPAAQSLTVRARLQNPPPPGFPREVTFTSPPLPDGRYVVSLAGIPNEVLAQYAANPEGIGRALSLILGYLGAGAAEGAPPARGGDVAVVVTHAVTDAPSIDVVVAGTGQVLADNLPYGQAAPPATLAAGTHRVEVRNAATGALIEAVRFTLDGTEGVFALTTTGFLDPSANQNGPAFRLTATDETGTTDPGVVVTGSEGSPVAGLSVAVANPARGAVSVRYAVPAGGPVRLALVDALGRVVAVLAEGEIAAGTHEVRLDAGALAAGAYVLRLDGAAGRIAQRVTVVR
jgi:hypothetical protein